jgi:type IV pilus assembly protein PilO
MTSGIRHFVFFVLMIGMAYASWAYMIRPADAALVMQRQALEEKQARLAELDRAGSTAVNLDEQLKQVEKAIRVFESKLPPKSQIHTVLGNVTLIAQKHGLTPKTISALKPSESNGYIEQPLKMELHGDFNAYYAFLLELERMDRITKIRELVLKKKDKSEGLTEATFIMSIFFMDSRV